MADNSGNEPASASREIVRLRRDGFRWEMVADFAGQLNAVLAAPTQVIKESEAKRVTVAAVGEKTFYLKRYLHSAVPFRGLKFFFKPSQARQEWMLAQQLEQLRIPVVRHVALGERWSKGGLAESILITEGFPGTSLEKVPAPDGASVLAFVNTMHERGVLQTDLHSGNLLASANGELRLVDLHGTTIKPALTQAERNQNLATLRLSVPIPVTPEVRQLSERLRRAHYERRSWRCLKQNRDFVFKHIGGLKWNIRRQFLTPKLERVLENPDAFLGREKNLEAQAGEIVASGDGMILECHHPRTFAEFFSESRARKNFRTAYHLELAGVPVARPIAAAECRTAGLLKKSFYLAEEIPGATKLSQWRGDFAPAARAAALLLARLHKEGFAHGDLKFSDIAFDNEQRAVLVGLHGLKFVDIVSATRAQEDLAHLIRELEKLPQFTAEHGETLRRLYEECRRETVQ